MRIECRPARSPFSASRRLPGGDARSCRFAVAPSVNLGLGSLPPERLNYASGLFNMMRNLGGAVGIAACGAILNTRTNFHFLSIASNLTPANGAMTRLVGGVAHRYASMPGSLDAG